MPGPQAMDTNHPGGTTTVLVNEGKLTCTTSYSDGVEKVEEFDLRTDECLVRKWKSTGPLGGSGKWTFEIGEAGVSGAGAGAGAGSASGSGDGDLLRVSSSQPVVANRESGDSWIWRIRNLPYPKDTYKLSIDDEKQDIVLRTTNKKYFKRISVPALRRAGIALSADNLSCEHANNTLIISYAKPDGVMAAEAEERTARRDKAKKAKDGDVECKSQ